MPTLMRRGRARQVRDQLVVDLRPGVDAARGGAVLAGVVEAERAYAARPPRRRSASSNTITGALPPSSRCVRFAPFAAACSTLSPVATSPVSETIATCGCSISAAPTVGPLPCTMLTTPGGNSSASSVASLSAVSGVCSRRLQHDGVAGRECGCHLPRRHHQRVVPRRDRRDHADRIAPDHAGVARQVFAGDRAGQRARGAGEEAEQSTMAGISSLSTARIRLAAVQRLQPRILCRFALRCASASLSSSLARSLRRWRSTLSNAVAPRPRRLRPARSTLRERHQRARRWPGSSTLLGVALAGTEAAVDQQLVG